MPVGYRPTVRGRRPQPIGAAGLFQQATDNLRAGQTQMLAVYPVDGNESGVGHLAAFDSMLGTGGGADRYTQFLNFGSWAALRSSVDALDPSARTPLLAIPLTVGSRNPTSATTSLAQVGTGSNDADFTYVAQTLAAKYPTGLIRARLGWEMNGDYFPWTALGKNADYIAAFQRAVTIMRAVSSRFRFSWCTNNINETAVTACDPVNCYPGDSYVDDIDQDCYFSTAYDNADPVIAWGYRYNGFSRGLQWAASFAATHSKPFTVSEWGVGDTDSYAPIVTLMADFLRTNNALYHGYWDAAPSPSCRVSDTSKPNTKAAFVSAFGVPVLTSATNLDTELNTPASLVLTTNHPVVWTLGTVDAGVSLSGTTLSLTSQATTGTRTAALTGVDTRGLTVSSTVTFTVLASYSYANTEASDYVARMTVAPPRTLKQAIDNLIGVLKTNSAYTTAKAIYLPAVHDSQAALLDIKGGASLTAINSPVFTAYRGFIGQYDGVAPKSLATAFTVSAASPFVQNSGAVTFWETVDIADNAPAFNMGPGFMNLRYSDNTTRGGINTYGSFATTASATSIGVLTAIRSGATASRLRRNGVTIQTDATTASNGLTTDPFRFYCGDPAYPSAHRIGFARIGNGALTDAQESAIYAGLQAYASAVGAPI